MKPSTDQLQHALDVAERMREQGEDPDYLSVTLLYLQHRVEALERVCVAANEYVRFGQEEREHAHLLQALENARESEERENRQEKQDFGL